MKPFNLEEYLKNPERKVVRKDGKDVRIICTDAKREYYPVIALVDDGCCESTIRYTKNGECVLGQENYCDLFFVSEKHEGWQNIYKSVDGNMIGSIVWPTKEEAERNANTSPTSLIKLVVTIKVEWEEYL